MSQHPPVSSVPAGWYVDPWNHAGLRWWDGAAWAGTPDDYSRPAAAAPATAPEGTGWNTPWIWLVALLPAVSVVLSLLVPWGSMLDADLLDPSRPPSAMSAETILRLTPLEWMVSLVGWLIYAACIYFAYLDHRRLKAMGVPTPFHWGWAALQVVYPIGRSIVVVRRTGHGWPPLWATIGVQLLGVIASVWITVEILRATFEIVGALSTQIPA